MRSKLEEKSFERKKNKVLWMLEAYVLFLFVAKIILAVAAFDE